MFADKEVEGIFALRGGFGSIHVAPLLDYKLIQANPKVLIGYSDITILLNAIHVKTGLVTFHGPTATSPFSDYTLAELRKVLCEAHTAIPLAAPPKNELKPGVVERRNRIKKISEGRARGRLVGGNLYCLLRMLGTPYAPDFNSSILFLEECGEKPYKIDGMLTQLRLAGVLQCVAAVVLGKFLAKPMLPDSELALEQLFADTFGDLQIPVIRGLMIGHISDQATIPIGVEASIDSDASQLILHENAVT
jgi:muramoyltetrapeptide carboxypeptidase